MTFGQEQAGDLDVSNRSIKIRTSFFLTVSVLSYCVFFNTYSAHTVLRTIMLLYTYSVLTLYVYMWFELLPNDLSVANAIGRTN